MEIKKQHEQEIYEFVMKYNRDESLELQPKKNMIVVQSHYLF